MINRPLTSGILPTKRLLFLESICFSYVLLALLRIRGRILNPLRLPFRHLGTLLRLNHLSGLGVGAVLVKIRAKVKPRLSGIARIFCTWISAPLRGAWMFSNGLSCDMG